MEKVRKEFSRRQFVKTGMGMAVGFTAGKVPAASSGVIEVLDRSASAETTPLLFPDDWVQMDNVAWRVELAKKDPKNPLLAPKYPWDIGACINGTILRDPFDGLWKLWYISSTGRTQSQILTYAESPDGVVWNRPMLDIYSYENYSRTNILLGKESGGGSAYPSVMIHPSAPKTRRYEMFIFRIPGWGSPDGNVRGFPLPPGEQKHPTGLYRYHSSDGIHWNPFERPIDLATSDSCYIYYGQEGGYVAYHKDQIPSLPGGLVPYDVGRGECRVVFRRTSEDGSHWSDPPRLVLSPDWRDPQDTQFMELTPLPQPGGFLALATVYHLLTSTIDLQFAASRDGVNWWRPDRRACVRLEALGDDEGGMLWPMRQMVEHQGRIYVYYNGGRGLHQDLYSTQYPVHDRPLKLHNQNYTLAVVVGDDSGGICRARWEKGRYWALVPASGAPLRGGWAVTQPAEIEGKRLYVNAVTGQGGDLTAELLDGKGKVVEGFSRESCNPFKGDEKHALLSWKGSKLPELKRASVGFYLHDARLYGFEWS